MDIRRPEFIGLARRAPELFRGIEWSTDRVFDQTMARAREAGLEVSLLETLDDVDTAEDLCRLVARVTIEMDGAPRSTRRALRDSGLIPERWTE